MITAKNERPAGAAAAFVEDKASNAPVYVRNLDAVFARGLQSRVWDSAGNDYIDLLADGGALPLGHNHPDVMRRVAAFLSSGQILPGLDTPTPARRALVEQLMRALPPSFAQDAGIQFCGLTASDAVEAMRRLFKAATGRHSLIAFHGACHGLRPGSLSHGGEMHFFPYPNGHRCSFGVGGYRGEDLALTYLDNALGDPRNGIAKPAAVLVEAVQAEGCIAASARWLRQLREITRKHDVPLVLDEMQSGFGRTGSMFAHEDAGIVPDAILLSKALGGGFPLAALAYHKRFDKWARGRAHPAVLGGSQIALAAGAATLEHIREGNIPTRAQRLGSYLQERLRALAGNDAPLKLRNLELYHDGRKFLEIEYELDARSYDYAVSLPGVERFKFADGKEFDLPELLAQLGGPPTDYVPPTVAHPLDDASATEDSPWTYTVPPETFVDPHGQALTLSATMDNGAPLPTWLSFDAKSGRFTGTPANADVGQRPVRVTATSESGLNVGDVFLLTVANVNDAPAAVAPWRETSTHEGEDWNYRIPDRTIVDEDADDRLTWSARMNNGDPLPAWLSFDAATRTFSGIPGASDTGSLDVQIMATDGAGASAFSTLMLRVATVPEALAAYAERPPAAASPEPGPSAAEPAAPAPTIVGTPGFDFLLGTFGNNHLQGLAGTDFLLGGFGDDVLDGGSEADLMWDFAGNDTYIVDNVGDLVFDWFGHDTARSTISYALGWTLEDLELTGTADVNGTGNYRDNMLRGNSAANFLDGRQGADTLAGGRGDDSLRGGEGSDTYLLARGDGRDIITEDDMPEIGVHEIDVDVVAFGPAISADQLWFRRIGSDLEVSIVGTTDMFTVRDWYVDSRHQVEQFRTSDGKLLQHTQVESLVQAMAGFDVPAGAQTAWLANDQNSLSGVIAANWN